MREAGIMIVELLLVIAVAVIIIYMGLERYRAYYHAMQFDLVQDDIVTIRQALNQYYNTVACDAQGDLQAPLNTDVIDQLDTLKMRLPYVDRYHALIIDSGTRSRSGKPIYQLKVALDVNSAYQSLLQWMTKRLQGTRYERPTIYWISLPNNSTAQPNSILWVMNTSRDQFKNLKNNAALAASQTSHAYCAR